MIQIPEGKTISGEDLAKMFQESKETINQIRLLIEKLDTEASVLTQVYPVKDVSETIRRNKR